MIRKYFSLLPLALALLLMSSVTLLKAQAPKISVNDTLTSVTIESGNYITFRVFAPSAQAVKIGGGDIPDKVRGAFTKSDDGVWSAKVGPVAAGSYRYNFNIDNVNVIDPRNPKTSESNECTWSLVHVPGQAFMDMQNVPHGDIHVVNYYSKALNRFRRMHIYTPPGYENNSEAYPVFYLLHGAWDSDNAWSTVGCANAILDNLIAEGKIKPMIVVMPAGHTGPFHAGMVGSKFGGGDFVDDFNVDIKPYVEKNFRVLKGRMNTAIAGLSMGGMQTLNIGIPHLDEFAYIGVFSSGVFSINNPAMGNGPSWEEQNAKMLDDAALKNDLKVVWFATGKEDFLLQTSKATVEMLKKHKFNVTFKESEGGHTWPNWRDYLHEFSQLLFK